MTHERVSSSQLSVARRHALHVGMRAGHRIGLLTDPYQAWTRLQADLRAARTTIAIELYMLMPDEVGNAFADELALACGRGVSVRLMLDSLGSMDLTDELLLRMNEAGVETQFYGPLHLSEPWSRWARRNHRKVFMIDDRVVHVTGMNVSADYFALKPGTPSWADVGVRVEGPLVLDVAAELARHWRQGRRKSRADRRSETLRLQSAKEPQHTRTLATVAFNHGRIRQANVSRRYLQAVRAARESILLAQSYFLPERALERALVKAAKAGRDVRIVLPALSTSDVKIVALASTHALGRLLRAGVRVYFSEHRMIHAKFGVVDGKWWTVGSANLDPLSHQRNLEANVVGIGEQQARVLRRYFDELCLDARLLTAEAWRKRPLWQRFLGWLVQVLRPIL